MKDLPLLTAGAMREIEAHAINSGAVTGAELMEAAGRAVVQAIWAQWPDLAATPRRALVLCGPGNNGGDGYVVARHLAQAGWQVDVHASAPAQTDAARQMADRWAALGQVQALGQLTRDPEALQAYSVVIDAIYGSGLSRPFQDHADLQMTLAALARAGRGGRFGPGRADPDRVRFVAVDLPSGLCADSGRVLGAVDAVDARDALHADLTVTFETPFLGHMLDEGPSLCGQIKVLPLGRAVAQARRAMAGQGWVSALDAPDPAILAKSATGHKFQHGHAVIVAGPLGQGGAAQLAARAALRIGAGLVTLAPPEDAILEHALAPFAALMQRPVEGAVDLQALLHDRRITALCLGPGLGASSPAMPDANLDANSAAVALGGRAGQQADRARDLIAAALDDGRPVTLDADGLRLIASDQGLRLKLHPKLVLTPHAGEFAALCPEIAARLAEPALRGPGYSRVDAARDAARLLGVVVVLKGPATVIASPSGRAALHGGAHRACPDLATAGTGDVLAGLITGLMARGQVPFRAACAAVWIHAELGRMLGPGLVADDLVGALPDLLRRLIGAAP